MGTGMGTLNHWEGEWGVLGGGVGCREVTPATLHGADLSQPRSLVTPVQLAKPGVEFPFGFVFCFNKKYAVFTLLWK